MDEWSDQGSDDEEDEDDSWGQPTAWPLPGTLDREE